MVYAMNSHLLLTFLTDIIPVQTSLTTFLNATIVDSFLAARYRNIAVITRHIAVTQYPVAVNWAKKSLICPHAPVVAKNFMKVGSWQSSTAATTKAMISESMILSVSTVPIDLANETPSYFFSTPHLVNSPALGMIKLAA